MVGAPFLPPHPPPSGRLSAVSTILFTLWIPRTSFGTDLPTPSPRLGPAAESFWCVRCFVCVVGVALCRRVRGVFCDRGQLAKVCDRVCACVENRFQGIVREASGDVGFCLEGALLSPNRLKNLSRSQSSVKECFSNVCHCTMLLLTVCDN